MSLRRWRIGLSVPLVVFLLVVPHSRTAIGAVPSRLAAAAPGLVADSRRATAEDLELILTSAGLNAEPALGLQVNGRPALTDRGFVHIPAAAFHPGTTRDLILDGHGEFYFSDGFVYGSAPTSQGWTRCTSVVAPVHLPHGVTVDLVALSGVDETSEALDLVLQRVYIYEPDSVPEALSQISTDTATSGVFLWLDGTIELGLIDNVNYHYYLAACLDDQRKIRSVFVNYEE